MHMNMDRSNTSATLLLTETGAAATNVAYARRIAADCGLFEL
jgi:hypothetical protein